MLRFWSQVNRSADGCWTWKGSIASTGYGQFWLNGTNVGAHRVAWQLTHGRIPPGLCVCHRCDNRICVRPDHLFLGTISDNHADMVAKGRQAKGERAGPRPGRRAHGERHGSRTHPEAVLRGARHPRAKLSEADVEAIREAYAAGALQRELAARFGVTQVHISRIVRKAGWRNPC